MTPEEYEERRTRMGASEVAAILNISPYTTAWEVQQTKLGKLKRDSDKPWTQAGNDFERALLDIAERELGALARQYIVLHTSLPLAATLDGITALSGNPVEAKTTGLVGPVQGYWGEAGTDQVPDQYLVQVHAQLMCCGSDLAYLYAMIAGRGVVRFEIEPKPDFHEYLGNRIADWWNRHIDQGHPVEQSPAPPLEVVKRLRKIPNKTIELGDDVAQLVMAWSNEKDLASAADKLAKETEAKIRMAMGDAECGLLPDGRKLELFETKRKGYTVEPTTYRQLRIKKG